MDPFAEVVTPTQKFKTRTIENAGKTPKWNQIFDMEVKDMAGDFTITVFDKDDYSNDTVGSITLRFAHFIKKGTEEYDAWHDLTYEGKAAGKINLVSTWHPDAPVEEEKASESDVSMIQANSVADSGAAATDQAVSEASILLGSVAELETAATRRVDEQSEAATEKPGEIQATLETETEADTEAEPARSTMNEEARSKAQE